SVPDWAKFVATPVYEIAQQYRMMMSSINSAARVGYVMRNAEALRGADGKIPPAALNKLMNDARTMAGDFSRKPGNPTVQKLDSISPYTNVMLRSTQNMWQRMKEDPQVLAMAMSGVILPKLYSDYIMSNWDK